MSLGHRKSPAEAWKSFVDFDCVRFMKIFETTQYAVLYSAIAVFVGAAIQKLFLPLYPLTKYKNHGTTLENQSQFLKTLLIVIVNVCVIALSTFYIRKFMEIIPPFVNFCPRYISSFGVEEALSGETAIGLVLVGIQSNLIYELDLLAHWMTNK